jgi:hypothetical protein
MLSFFFELGASCICPMYYELRPFAPFGYTLLIKKRKRKALHINNLTELGTCNAQMAFHTSTPPPHESIVPLPKLGSPCQDGKHFWL